MAKEERGETMKLTRNQELALLTILTISLIVALVWYGVNTIPLQQEINEQLKDCNCSVLYKCEKGWVVRPYEDFSDMALAPQ